MKEKSENKSDNINVNMVIQDMSYK